VLGLVIDTSSAAVTAGVVEFGSDPGGSAAAGPSVLASRRTIDARGHGELLAPAVRDCLAEAGVRMSDLAAVVAGVGPGPFTGLRVGLVTAAVLADARGIPAYGVCSLDAIAAELAAEYRAAESRVAEHRAVEHRAEASGELLVAGDARRKEVYWARYADGRRLSDPAVDKPADLRVAVTAMAGAGARMYAELLGFSLLDRDFPPVSGLAALAARRVLDRAPSEPLTPLYLRRPDAVAGAASKRVTA
jgi:tRNA threonylcarbamoyl adenosine modification protein YeaZ